MTLSLNSALSCHHEKHNKPSSLPQHHLNIYILLLNKPIQDRNINDREAALRDENMDYFLAFLKVHLWWPNFFYI